MFKEIADWIAFSLFNADLASHFGQSLQYFVEDSVRILLLLFVMIFFIGVLRSYLPAHKIKKWLTGRKAGIGNFFAAVFGAITPFCSCSSIPIFIGFLEAEVPLGIAFSFLITSPLINEYVVVIMLGLFGWKITAAYIASGILLGVFGGLILGRMKLEKHIAHDLIASREKMKKESKFKKFSDRLAFGFNESKSITAKLWGWILVGVGIGALLHNYVPQSFVQGVINKGGIFTVPLATLIGVPLYGSSAALVPIAVALFEKGVPLGTALAFLMATAALSFPEAVILRRAMNLKLIIIFFSVVALAIMAIGYLFNLLQPLLM